MTLRLAVFALSPMFRRGNLGTSGKIARLTQINVLATPTWLDRLSTAEKVHEPVLLGTANLMRMVAASMFLLSVLVVATVSDSAGLTSVTSSPAAMATARHSSAIGATMSAASHQHLGHDAPVPCSDHSGSAQCCGTHCPCPPANVISAEATGLGAMLVLASGPIPATYFPAGSVKSPNERPPRLV